jgi:glycosyltransferase involved in cell wall biosynthesis
MRSFGAEYRNRGGFQTLHRKEPGIVVFFDAGDRVVHNVASSFARRGIRVFETASLRQLLGVVSQAQHVAVTLSRRLTFGSFARTYLALLLLAVAQTRVLVFFSTDYVDLVESRVARSFFTVMHRLLLKRAHRVFLLRTRRHIAERYGFDPHRVRYIDNFFWSEELSNSSKANVDLAQIDGQCVFFYAGYNLWWHGLDRFYVLFKKLKERYPDSLLVVAGPVESSPFLKCFGRERRYWSWFNAIMSDRSVLLLGPLGREQLYWWLRQAHFFVSCLDTDSIQGRTELRTCLIEAMAAGAACLNVRTPELIDTNIFRDGENVILLEGDEEENLEKLAFYMTMPYLRRQIGRRARRTAQGCFRIEDWVTENLEELCEYPFPVVHRLTRTVDALSGAGPSAVFGSAPASQVTDVLRAVQRGHDGTCYLITPRRGFPEEMSEQGVHRLIAGERWIHWFGLGIRNIVALRRQGIRRAFIPITKGTGEGYGNVSRTARVIGVRQIYFVRDGLVVNEAGNGVAVFCREFCRAVTDTLTVVLAAAFGLLVILAMEIRSAFLKPKPVCEKLQKEHETVEQKRVVNE